MKDRMLGLLRQLYESNPVLTITGWLNWIRAAF
jgi:hypothetical protein